ncbi:unnamed protein product [Cyclocybe aegerita]|uniref:Uncharacterized protein n=1 Tax=Cyclocybe aegerita TaxID=1973307 RepID=A0A8S0W4J2_CYCAE|nr:unnamed protein product [Cyclocybe aegerita]
MATSSVLAQLLHLLRKFVTAIFKANPILRALTLFLRRILFWWSIVRKRWRRLLGWKGERQPSLQDGPKRGRWSIVVDAASKEKREEILDEATPSSSDAFPCTLVKDGEAVPIADAAHSLYPYSDGIRNSSRSSQSLQAARSSHNLTIMARNASRSSHNFGSDWSRSIHSEDEGYTFDVEQTPTAAHTPRPNPRAPVPRRQWSTSLPELEKLKSSVGIPMCQLTSGTPEIEIFSPTGRSVPPVEFTQSESPTPARYLEIERISPVMPEAAQRYENRPVIRKVETEVTIDSLTTSFVKPLPPEGWAKHTHPEGARYFYHKEKRVYTDADLYDDDILTQAHEDLETMENFISKNHITLPENHDLVIDLRYQEDKTIATTYYYVDHTSRTIFFLDTYEARNLYACYEILGCKTDSHLGHEIEAQYWLFVQFYPNSIPLTSMLISELRDVALHFIGDSMTSPFSTSPYTMDDLYKILTLTSNAEKNIGLRSVGTTSLLTRLLYIFAHARFHNFHGEAHARIERNISVYGESTTRRTWLIKAMSPILFSAPDVHLRTLQKMWVDKLMHKAVWEESVKKMNDEWQEFILFATVLLNANVAFLAIQSVDIEQDPYRSAAQISSYLSVTASIGSIILGLLLIRQNRTKNRETAEDVHKFLLRRSHSSLGLETLAILYSLPYALLMWAMVSFLAAFACMCFQDSNITTRVSVGSLCVALVVLVAWCVWSAWESQPEDNAVALPPSDSESARPSEKASEKASQVVRKATLLDWQWIPSFLRMTTRRESYDSQETAV